MDPVGMGDIHMVLSLSYNIHVGIYVVEMTQRLNTYHSILYNMMIRCAMCNARSIFTDYEGNQYCTRCKK